jgi:hypothetical protein
LALAAAALLLAGPAVAMVYTVKPGTPARSVAAALQPREVLQDRLEVNGQSGEFSVSVTSLTLAEALAALRPLLAESPHAAAPGQVLIEVTDEPAWLTRYYLLSTGEQQLTMVFRLRIPRAALADKGTGEWPAGLPRLQADDVGPVMALGRRGVLYVPFTTGTHPTALAREYDAALQAAGWRRVGPASGDGGVYQHPREGKLAMFSVIATATGGRGAIFVTAFEKLPEQ